ncbi:hypothetical protein B0H11DRAFT_1916540 [Mycena galericulata]|nr:hypothetical protein B0H11DRAFT_1916540 [Mycena galericulata]
MTRGKAMSDDLRGPSYKKRTIERVLEDYHKKCTVMREHLRLEMCGAKRSMSCANIRGWYGTVLTMAVDSQPAINATQNIRPTPSHYLWDLWHAHMSTTAKTERPSLEGKATCRRLNTEPYVHYQGVIFAIQLASAAMNGI